MSEGPQQLRRAPRATAPAGTRTALLAAAGAVFAEHGFRDATVRDICERAGANVAAVNYHFGDKERLYREVLRHAMAEAHSRHPFDGGLPAGASAEARLRAFVHSLLSRLFDTGTQAWLGRLMAKEMIDPSSALDVLMTDRIAPMVEHLGAIIRDLLPPAVAEDTVWLTGFSIVSQCLFYNHCRSVVSRLRPRQLSDADAVERLTDHITRFSLAGIRSLAGRHPPRRLPGRRAASGHHRR
jgi:AcrR family transcriptional regulator